MLNFDSAGSRNFGTGDFLGDIINRSIGADKVRKSKSKASSDLVPHNSISELKNDNMAKVTKLMEGPTEILERGATIQCVNCGNMAKNMVYLENYIKTNGSKKSPCATCATSLSFLEYLNKNIQQVFHNINSAGVFVLEKQTIVPNRQMEANPKPTVREIKRPAKPKNKPVKSEMSTITNTTKSVDKVRTKKKKVKTLKADISSPSSADQGSATRPVRPKVKKTRKRPKNASKLEDKSHQSTISK